MSYIKGFVAAPAIAFLLSGTAHAALTAEQVWQSWKDGAVLAGLSISAATEAKSSGILSVNGLKIVAPGAEDAPLTVSDITFAENSDGSVTITPGSDIGLNAGKDDEKLSVKLVHKDLLITAREGQSGGIVYDYKAADLKADFDSSWVSYTPYVEEGADPAEAEKPEPATAKGSVALEGLSGSYSDTPGANRSFGLDLAATRLVYDVVTEDPAFQSKSNQQSETADLKLQGSFVLPASIALGAIQSGSDFKAALDQGLALTMNTSQGVSTSTQAQEDQFMPYSLAMSMDPSTADLSFSKAGLAMNSAGGRFTLDATSAMSEQPMKITGEGVEVAMKSPVVAVDAAEDYAFLLKLSQVTLSDDVWGLFDPNADLKREPFDLALDLDGKAKVDWAAMIDAEETGAHVPSPEPQSLNVKQAALKLAGAALDATAALTFDNAAGFPAPLGEANVSISGANQLIDGLIKVGILSEQDAMMARMMMGGFMVPGATEDSLTSKIEFKEGFQIFANGQQIQ